MIKKARQAKGLTLRAMAAELGLSVAFIFDLENGRRAIPERRLAQLACVLDLDPDELAHHAGVIPPDIREWLKGPKAVRLVRALMEAA